MVFRLAIFTLIFIATSGAWAAPLSENLARAVQVNNPAALFQLALLRHTENKTTEAIGLHTQAASQGFQASMIWLRNNALQDGNTAEALLWAKQLVQRGSLDTINTHLLPLLEPGMLESENAMWERARVLNAATAYQQGQALLASRETMNDRETADQGAIAVAYLHYAAQEKPVQASQALADLFKKGQENAFPWRDDGQAAYWNAAATAPVKPLLECLASFAEAPSDQEWSCSTLANHGCYYDAQAQGVQCSRCDGSFADNGRCKAHFPDCGIAAAEPVAAPSQPPAPQNAAAACSPAPLLAGNAPAMSSLEARIASFAGHEHPFTSKGITTLALAEAGLYCLKDSDRVRCYSCNGTLSKWMDTDNPQAEHARHFPTCAFVKCQAASAQCLAAAQLPAGNAPVDPATMSSLQARIASFAGHEHPFTRKGINTLALAEAGLYCLKNKDHVCCYSCKKTLSNWMSTDNPQTEHARYFPDCALVKCQAASAQCPAAAQLPNTETLSVGMQNLNIASAANASTPAVDAALIDEEQRLIAENRQLIEARTCKVCMDKETNTVFLPCGHLVSCQECAPKLRDCPLCRTYIRGTVKSFFS